MLFPIREKDAHLNRAISSIFPALFCLPPKTADDLIINYASDVIDLAAIPQLDLVQFRHPLTS